MTELSDPRSHSSGGLTLSEMKAAASQAGFDPAIVERAARLLRTNPPLSVTERIIGGRKRHRSEAHFPIVLDGAGTARLLSAVQIGVGESGDAHSGPTGVTWRSSDSGGAVLSLQALVDHGGTSVNVDIDRRGTLALVGTVTLIGSFMAGAFGGTVAGEIIPGLEVVGGLSGAGAAIAIARSYWASSTRAARERLSQVMESVSGFLTPADAASLGAPGKLVEADGAEDEVV